MNSLFPLIYSVTLFLFLCLISYFLIKQIIDIQKLERKIFDLQENIKNDNTSYETYYKLGQLYLKKKLFSKAILLFRKTLKLINKNDTIGLGSLYNTLGFTYFTLKKYSLAIYYYEIAVQILPDYTLSLINLAYAYEKQNLISKAYDCYRIASVYDPENKLILRRIRIVENLVTK